MLSCAIGCDASDVHVGMRVRVAFPSIGDRNLPYFEPA